MADKLSSAEATEQKTEDKLNSAEATEQIVQMAQKKSEDISISIEQNRQSVLEAVDKKLKRKRNLRTRAVKAAKHEAEVEAAKLEIFEKIDKARSGSPYGAAPVPDRGATRQAETLLGDIRARLEEPVVTDESDEERKVRIVGQVHKDVERLVRRQPVIEKHSKQVIIEKPAEIPLPLQDLPVEEEIKAEIEAEIAARDAANEKDEPEDSD